MYGHLIFLDKQPSVFLVSVGETWRRIFAKCALTITGPESNSMCQDYQICDRLKAVIDGEAHGVQSICGAKLTTEDWVFLLVDSKNLSTI